MWMLVFMMVVNAVLHQQGIQNEYRISLGIIQIGILDFTLAAGLLYALLRGGATRAQFPAMRTHPVLIWIIAPMLVGGMFGVLGAVMHANELKWILSSAREYFAIPACVFIGYALIGTPRNVRTATIWALIAGVLTASMLLYTFGSKTETAQLTGTLHPVRGIITHFHSEYAAATALVMIFVVLTRFPLWRTTICVLVGLYCYIGYASTLSRLGFVILLFGTAATYLLLPHGERFRKFLRSLVFIPILLFACWGSLWVADQVIGRDFAGKVTKHILSLLPGDHEGVNERAWDSRIGGIITEMGIWLRNPLMGQGFGTGETQYLAGRTQGHVAIKHNGWTAFLSETGIFGFVGVVVLIGSMLVIGYRMVHDGTDNTSVLVGALGFMTGVVFFLRCSGTMITTTRAAIGFGLIAGILIRAREIQESAQVLAQQAASYDPYVDAESGLLVPDYAWDMGHFGTTN